LLEAREEIAANASLHVRMSLVDPGQPHSPTNAISHGQPHGQGSEVTRASPDVAHDHGRRSAEHVDRNPNVLGGAARKPDSSRSENRVAGFKN
jgi:hypothetical protein